jgi:hypothetical protein
MTTLNINQTIAAGARYTQTFTTSTPAGEGNPVAIDLTYSGDATICIVDANGSMEITPSATQQPGSPSSGGRVQHIYVDGGCADCNYSLQISSASGATITGTISFT